MNEYLLLDHVSRTTIPCEPASPPWVGGPRWRGMVEVLEGGGEVGKLAKVWVGLKKVGNVHRRLPEVNGGECCWKRRAGEEMIDRYLAVIDEVTDTARFVCVFKISR